MLLGSALRRRGASSRAWAGRKENDAGGGNAKPSEIPKPSSPPEAPIWGWARPSSVRLVVELLALVLLVVESLVLLVVELLVRLVVELLVVVLLVVELPFVALLVLELLVLKT